MKLLNSLMKYGAIAIVTFCIVYFSGDHIISNNLLEKIGLRKNDSISHLSEHSKKNRTEILRFATTEDYRVAWDQVAAKKLPRKERIALQTNLLKKWADVDLKGALAAALAESWDMSEDVNHHYMKLGFQDAFAQVFADRPNEVWKMIQENQLGVLESGIIRNAFFCAIADKQPQLLCTYLKELDGLAFYNSLRAAGDNLSDRSVLKNLCELAEQKGVAEQPDTKYLLSGNLYKNRLSEETVIKEAANATGFLQKVYAAYLSSILSVEGRGGVKFSNYPESIRDELAKNLLLKFYGSKDALRDTMDYLLENQKWDILKSTTCKNAVISISRSTNPKDYANWAIHLPAREETNEIFHRAVSTYMQAPHEEVWQWITQIPNSHWRDRALAEYSQVSLYQKNDDVHSRQALDQIQDPAFKQEAESWRKSWEDRKTKQKQ